jgi:hypothetical protein
MNKFEFFSRPYIVDEFCWNFDRVMEGINATIQNIDRCTFPFLFRFAENIHVKIPSHRTLRVHRRIVGQGSPSSLFRKI